MAKDSDQQAIQACQQHLQSFAENGYRTLCFSTRKIPEDFYNQWNKKHHEASVSLDNRNEKLAEAAEQIEKELTLIGATAIEDKLQDVKTSCSVIIKCFIFSLCPKLLKHSWQPTFVFGF